jgi:hypothetical protein
MSVVASPVIADGAPCKHHRALLRVALEKERKRFVLREMGEGCDSLRQKPDPLQKSVDEGISIWRRRKIAYREEELACRRGAEWPQGRRKGLRIRGAEWASRAAESDEEGHGRDG